MSMNEELEQSGTDVSSEVSSTPSESESSESSASPEQSAASQEQKQYVPYDRFKELVEQKNQFAKQFEEQQKTLKELQARFDQPQKPAEVSKEKALIERLKGIDPEFGTWAEQQESAKAQLREMQERYQQAETERNKAEVSSTLDKLYTENSVPKEAQEMYKALIREQAVSNPDLTHKDLPKVFKAVHETFSKFLEAQKRSTLTSYATAKKTDSRVPTSPKGPAPKTNPKFEYSNDREEAKSQMIKRAMERIRANSNE